MTAGQIVDESQCRFTINDNIISSTDWRKGSSNEGLAKLILNNFNQYPDFVGQINTKTGERTTYAEFRNRSIRCALWLKKQGLGKHDVVCTAIPLQDDDYVPILATFFVGAIINPWHHQMASATTTSFFKLLKPKVMFTCEQSIDALVAAAKDAEVICKFVVLGNHSSYQSLEHLMAQQSQDEVDNFQLEPKDPDEVGGIIFSSGTTGVQKCVMLSYNTLLHNRMNYIPAFEDTKVLWYSSYTWITGLVFFITCVKFRFTRILHPSAFDAEETSSVIEKYKVTWAYFSSTIVARLQHENVYKRYDYSELKVIVIGGMRPSKLILEKTREALPHCLVANSYGMTELGGLTTIQRKNCKIVNSIGYVVGGVDVKVIDPKTGIKVGPNQAGEICVKVEYVMIGYFKNDEGTKNTIDKEGWLHTGDLGYYSEDGEIVILDRIVHTIVTRNHRISPSQIEDILLQHPAVLDVAVVSVPHEVEIQIPLAFVIKRPGANVTAEELIELLATYNKLFRLTGGIMFVEELPYILNGKKNIKELRERARAKVEQILVANNKSSFLNVM